MQIRDTTRQYVADDPIITMSNFMDILAGDGNVLYRLELQRDGRLIISTIGDVVHSGTTLVDRLCVYPESVDTVSLARDRYID